jgi:hypothetical protein
MFIALSCLLFYGLGYLLVFCSEAASLGGEIAYANRPPTGVTQNRAVGTRYLTCNQSSALPVVADLSIWGQIKIQEASTSGATPNPNEISL